MGTVPGILDGVTTLEAFDMGKLFRVHQLLILGVTTLAALKSLDESFRYFRNRAREEEKPRTSPLIVVDHS